MEEGNILKTPIPIAHRGCFDVAPENSLASFKEAVTAGMGGIEIDIRKTLDGEIVVFHDETPERLTLGCKQKYAKNKISELTLEQVKQIRLPFAGHMLRFFPQDGFKNEIHYYYPWELAEEKTRTKWLQDNGNLDTLYHIVKHSEKKYLELFEKDSRTEEVLTLEEFLNWLNTTPEYFFAEIEYKDQDMTQKVVDLLEKTNTMSRCILFSGVREYNQEIQTWVLQNEMKEKIKLGANIRFITEETLRMIDEWSLFEVGLNAGRFTSDDVKMLRNRGVAVFSNLGDYCDWWDQIQDIGIAGFKTNTGKKYLQRVSYK